MVDDKRRDQHGQPAAGKQRIQSESSSGASDIPDHTAHGLPFPEQQQQSETRKQYIRAALNWHGYDSGPRGLKPWPRHLVRASQILRPEVVKALSGMALGILLSNNNI